MRLPYLPDRAGGEVKAYWWGSAKVYNADEVDAEIARLREAISEFVEAFDRDPIKYADLMDRTREAVDGLYEIAREGR